MTTQPTRSLQDLLDSQPSIVDYLYSNRKGSVLKDAVLRQPTQFVAPEFTDWRDEQMAWRHGIAFYDQSFHMTTTFLRGKDAQNLMSHLAVNSFATFGPDRSRHAVLCNPDGHYIGDGMLLGLGPEELVLIGRGAGHNWVRYNASQGKWDVEYEADEFFSDNPNGRRAFYRYQVEGPDAPALIEELIGGPLPKAPRMHILDAAIAGKPVKVLQFTMAGNPGAEFFGPWDEGPAVKEAILAAGAAVNMKRVGSLAYFTNALELNWIPRPMTAVFTGEGMRPFRQWLPATAPEGTWALGGSYDAPNIEDYYVTPWELDYGNVVKFDHDFVGREALERSAGNEHRRKVRLIWNPADVAKVTETYMHPNELPALYLELPRATYATWQYDAVLDNEGNKIGASTYTGFLWTERSMVSLAIIDPRFAAPGTEVRVIWGEPDEGRRSRPWLAPHRQVELRATVAPIASSA